MFLLQLTTSLYNPNKQGFSSDSPLFMVVYYDSEWPCYGKWMFFSSAEYDFRHSVPPGFLFLHYVSKPGDGGAASLVAPGAASTPVQVPYWPVKTGSCSSALHREGSLGLRRKPLQINRYSTELSADLVPCALA